MLKEEVVAQFEIPPLRYLPGGTKKPREPSVTARLDEYEAEAGWDFLFLNQNLYKGAEMRLRTLLVKLLRSLTL
jgi:hypothetical protein